MDIFSRPAEEFHNDEMVEELWAKKAIEHAEIYFNLICSVDPRLLKLTPYDDQIYTAFRQDFPELKIGKLTDDDLKTPAEKIRWRAFINKFNKLDDHSYGTLLRADSTKECVEDNAIFVPRVQFLAIEIARNREGQNDGLREKFKDKVKKMKEIYEEDDDDDESD